MADVYWPCSDHTAVRSPVPAGRATLEQPDNESVCRLGDIVVFTHFFASQPEAGLEDLGCLPCLLLRPLGMINSLTS